MKSAWIWLTAASGPHGAVGLPEVTTPTRIPLTPQNDTLAARFTSRVGSGPFPAEVEGDLALRLRGTGENPWDEYGTTTGPPRRVGWLECRLASAALCSCISNSIAPREGIICVPFAV